ncbi:S8 family serine peptidase [Flavobacterium kingsejongi]|uniref:Peptidase S8/S53 domain-containing protein n=1 Tax=Flavobacterium kingsejongi TaxID=1678728 RepID=A0A2S1LKQ3_9FLAO|nr:S8 family serine peptidase [Flavobacterium kingsejongi]AWG24298.1 hypothetical protein FK004_03190 [Flavobacterium kingsejongi]
MKLKIIFTIFLSFLFYHCTTVKTYKPIAFESGAISRKAKLTPEQQKNWQDRDAVADTIPGTSLEKAYRDLLSGKKGKKIIVAVIDETIDIHHKDLKDNIWTNTGEIPDNGIDDDHNGYIDDIHGWNFTSNPKGENILYANMESIRIIRKFRGEFENKSPDVIPENRKKDFILYQKGLKEYQALQKDMQEEQDYVKFLKEGYVKSKKSLKHYFPKEDYTLVRLDSLYRLYSAEKQLGDDIYYMMDYMKNNLSEEWIANYGKDIQEKMDKSINLEYDDRSITGDDPEDLTDINYGSNTVAANVTVLQHGTKVAGVLVAAEKNQKDIKKSTSRIVIMPLSLAAKGNENDKDIALAIRYAVDNGASVINMSFGKLLSLHEEWILEAIRYAAAKDVLIVSAAGNGNTEVSRENPYYPNDSDYIHDEVSDNFIKVGAISNAITEKLVASFTNYSQTQVDLFAPGERIYTTVVGDRYDFFNGTSAATPVVAGIAALIRSYYPKLTAPQIKQLLMDSGLSFPIAVQVPGATKGTVKPFSEFSRSGKVVNAYNALLMADLISKNKTK